MGQKTSRVFSADCLDSSSVLLRPEHGQNAEKVALKVKNTVKQTVSRVAFVGAGRRSLAH